MSSILYIRSYYNLPLAVRGYRVEVLNGQYAGRKGTILGAKSTALRIRLDNLLDGSGFLHRLGGTRHFHPEDLKYLGKPGPA